MPKKSKKKVVPTKNLASEFLSTLTLTLAVSCSLQVDLPLSTPLIAALTVAMFVYTVGPVSGAHINPAVTIALWSVRLVDWRNAIAYIVAQLLGASVGMVVAYALVGGMPYPPVEDTALVALCEFIGASILVFGISSVAHKQTPYEASGLVIGGSLLLGILIASIGSNGVLNPAVAFGINSLSIVYVAAPILGGIAGAIAGKAVHAK